MTSAHTALPLPSGQPGPLHRLVASLRVAADRLTQTQLAQGGQARDLAPSWDGPAWLAAEAELRGAHGGSHALANALATVVLVLREYAVQLDATIGEITHLQRAWTQAEARHRRLASLAAGHAGTPLSGPTLAELDLDLSQERARLRGRHTRLMSSLIEAGTRAVAAIRVCRAAPLSDRQLGATLGADWYGTLAAALPMSVHSTRSAAARAAVSDAFAGTPPLHEWSADDVDGLVRLDTSDPSVAGALVDLLGIDGLTLLATRLAKSNPHDPAASSRADLALARLGTALRVALDAGAWADDPRWVAQVQQTTARWRAAVSEPRATEDLPGGFPVLTVQAHALLLHASRDSATGPLSAAVLSTLATAAAAAEADGAIWATVPGSDPMALVVSELRRDAGAAWRVLLRDVAPGVSLLGYLVERRGRFLDDQRAAQTVAVDLDHLMATIATRSDRPSVHLAAEFLASLATASVATEDASEAALQMSRYLTNFRASLAAVLLAHPELLSAVHAPRPVDSETIAMLKGWSPGPSRQEGRDSAGSIALDPSPAAFVSRVHLVDDGSELSLRLDDISSLTALLGLLGVSVDDQLTLDGRGVSAAPVLARATAPHVDSLLASLRSRDVHATSEAAARIGALHGFGITAAAMVQSNHAATIDAQIETQRSIAEGVMGQIRLPARVTSGPVGIIAGLVLDRVMSADPATFIPSLRVHASHDASVEQAAYSSATRLELRMLAWDSVSESRCWSDSASPQAWIRSHPGPDFTDTTGRPLPLATMSPEQVGRMVLWARSVPEYERVDAAVVEGFSAGRELAMTSAKPAVLLEQLADLGKSQP